MFDVWTPKGFGMLPDAVVEDWRSTSRVIVRVCDPCHKWLNEKYEGASRPIVEPLLLGQTTVLNRDTQAFVAGYLIKTALLIGRWGRIPAELRAPQTLVREFRQEDGVSDRWAVWIGRIAEPEATVGGLFVSRNSQVTPRAGARERLPPGARGGHWAFGRLTVQWLVQDRHAGMIHQPKSLLRAIREAVEKDILVQIWPQVHENVPYPPGPHITIETLRTIADATETWPLDEAPGTRTLWTPGSSTQPMGLVTST